jgi:hypothetical protein
MKKLALLSLLCLGVFSACQNETPNPADLRETDLNSSQIEIPKEEVGSPITDNQNAIEHPQVEKRAICTGKSTPKTTESSTKSTLVSTKADLSEYLPNVEEFIINPKKTEKIRTQNGTEFIIPKGSFDTDLPIKISMRVYEDQKDAYMQQLTTMTTDGGILESAGMFHIEAFTPKGKIDLVEHAEVLLIMPEEVDGAMDIYYGEKDERGDVYWNLDENSKVLAPIPVLVGGRFTYTARQYFIDHFKMSKEDLLALEGKQWTANITLDRAGYMIGWDDVNGDSLKDEASRYFIEFMKNHNFYKDPANWQLSPSFTFTAMSKEALDTLKAVEEYDKMMKEVWNNFEPSTADRRKRFTIGGLGYINVDREIQLPDLKQRTDVLVKKEGNADLKLMFVDNNSVVAASAYSEDYIIFKDVPLKSKVRLVGSCTRGLQMYYGVKEQTITKEKNEVELEFLPCTRAEFSSKIGDFLAEG